MIRRLLYGSEAQIKDGPAVPRLIGIGDGKVCKIRAVGSTLAQKGWSAWAQLD